jgi:cytochrome oxidase Cu insertion factor (SCO1/SenC/PrrC family)
MKKKRVLIASITVLSIVLIIWAVILYQVFAIKSKESYYGSSYDMRAPDFTLTNQDGEKVTLGEFKGKVVFMFFGYTHCPDICPVTLANLSSAVNELGDDKDKVRVIFVTVDPERDSQAELKKYVTYFNKDFIGLTGTPDEIKNVAEVTAQYIREARIRLDPSRNQDSVTLHDPCNQSRMGGLAETLRFVLRSAVTDFVEMEPHGNENYCCGGGGGTVGFEEIYDFRMEVGGRKKVEQLKATGAKLVAAPCANCKKQLRELIDYHGLPMEVVGIHDLVAKALVFEGAKGVPGADKGRGI